MTKKHPQTDMVIDQARSPDQLLTNRREIEPKTTELEPGHKLWSVVVGHFWSLPVGETRGIDQVDRPDKKTSSLEPSNRSSGGVVLEGHWSWFFRSRLRRRTP
jgi:hypothetical protein